MKKTNIHISMNIEYFEKNIKKIINISNYEGKDNELVDDLNSLIPIINDYIKIRDRSILRDNNNELKKYKEEIEQIPWFRLK